MTERMLRSLLPALAAALLVPLPQAAHAQSRGVAESRASPLQREIAERAKDDIRSFYAARDFQPLWLDPAGRLSPAAQVLLDHLRTAQFDGIDTKAIGYDKLARLAEKARRGDAGDGAKAEVALSAAYAAYVRATRGADRAGMIYESRALAPSVPSVRAALDAVAQASSVDDYLSGMRWMHPFYAPLRAALEDSGYSEDQRQQIWTNLERVRALPAMPSGRYILVDASSAQLWMYENGQPVDSMKVVVGKPELQTPMMAGFIRSAILNPYWNVPDDLVMTNIANNVLERGVGYLKSGGYQVFSDAREDAPMVDPKTVNWQDVQQGRRKVRVRQLPGRSNFMGKVKFEFPNPQGIYLHDTPDRHLLDETARQFSSGCVRLEDAPRLHRWLMGEPMPARVRQPETAVELPEPVPVYITYLTAMPEGGTIAFHNDPYRRDVVQLAAVETGASGSDRPN
jgi:L,D-transpeptidase YcbB